MQSKDHHQGFAHESLETTMISKNDMLRTTPAKNDDNLINPLELQV